MKTANTAIESVDQEPQELEICISCLKTNAPGTHFCGHCGTPLTSYAATAPFESIIAEGDIWRKAVSRGRYGWLVRLLIIAFLACLLLSFILGWMLPR
jgi:predicted amidophosphoribosyltransferase